MKSMFGRTDIIEQRRFFHSGLAVVSQRAVIVGNNELGAECFEKIAEHVPWIAAPAHHCVDHLMVLPTATLRRSTCERVLAMTVVAG